jgi:hypothetical protein
VSAARVRKFYCAEFPHISLCNAHFIFLDLITLITYIGRWAETEFGFVNNFLSFETFAVAPLFVIYLLMKLFPLPEHRELIDASEL